MTKRTQMQEVSEFIRASMKDALEHGTALRPMAIGVGTSHVTIMNIRDGRTKLIDSRLLDGFASYFGYKDMPALFDAAHEWAKKNEEVFEPPKDPNRVYDDRYPNRARAIIAARALGRSEAAIAIIAKVSFKDSTDPSPDDWLKDIETEERRLSRERRDPLGVARANALSEARHQVELERLRTEPSLDERAKAIQARRTEEPPPEEPARKTRIKPPARKK